MQVTLQKYNYCYDTGKLLFVFTKEEWWILEVILV